MLVLACLALSALIVIAAILVAVFDWAGHLPLAERLALDAIAAGLIWAAPDWFSIHQPPDLGDVLFLIGVGVLMAALYGRAVTRRLNTLASKPSGFVDWR